MGGGGGGGGSGGSVIIQDLGSIQTAATSARACWPSPWAAGGNGGDTFTASVGVSVAIGGSASGGEMAVRSA
ncbi:hypothetical protein [Achromobacter insolitus]|uniref:hypothetical protein n=1 Tax=Achromobacter insolitus TaxID=217204 RepID=UPI001FC91679|nr:hypothetical protein [Achromobacter insolitus]